MRIGVTIPNVHETLAERTTIEAVARAADDLGYDSVWCNDHVVIPASDDGPYSKRDGLPDPDVVSGAPPLVAAELEILTGRAVDVPPADEIYRRDLTVAWTP